MKKTITYLLLICVGLVIGLFINSDNEENHSESEHEHKGTIWTCSMHPQIKKDQPGKCPLCAMALIPLTDGSSVETNINQVQMSTAAMKLAEVQVAKVRSGNNSTYIDLSGKISADERNTAKVTAHFNGRVEKLYADFTGQKIRKGQKLATLYSPDLVTAQKELFEAIKFKTSQPSYFEAAVQKLKLWELTDEQINGIIEKGTPEYYFNVYAPRSGTILSKKISNGEHVKEGTVLFEIADLRKLWVLFDAYESDLATLKVGDSITFRAQSLPNEDFKSIISFIDPVLNNKTRTVSLRAEVVDKTERLRPDMFVDGRIKSRILDSNMMTVPKSAVLWTGKRSIVYVKVPNQDKPTFEFREITLGTSTPEGYVVEAGLKTDEEVVINGVFKIDATAQLEGKTSMMTKPITISNPIQKHPSMLDFKDQVKEIYQNYLKFKDALVASNLPEAKEETATLLQSIKEFKQENLTSGIQKSWQKDADNLTSILNNKGQSRNLDNLRESLLPLSATLYDILIKYDIQTGAYKQYCPMAFDFKGAYWLSDSDQIRNPYFGDQMLTCGSVEEKLK